MLNAEKYRYKLLAIAESGHGFASIGGMIVSCEDASCDKCDFNPMCAPNRTKWLCADADNRREIDWSKIPADTKVLVSDDGNTWVRRYFAGVDEIGLPTVYPYGCTSWSLGDLSPITCDKYIQLTID